MEKFFDFLNTTSEFSIADFEKVSPFFRPVNLKRGEVWIELNTICREMAFVDTGLLKISHYDGGGNQVTSCFCGSESMASSFKSFTSQTISDQRVEAIEDTSLLSVSFQEVQNLRKTVPAWERFERIILEKEYLSLSNHAHSLNSEQAFARYMRLLKNQPEIIRKASVQDVASYLGITRETLSRIRKRIDK